MDAEFEYFALNELQRKMFVLRFMHILENISKNLILEIF